MSSSSSSSSEDELLVYVDTNRGENYAPASGPKPAEHAEAPLPRSFEAIGLDGDEPLVRFGDEVFKGEYEDCAGTLLFFETDPNEPSSDRDEAFPASANTGKKQKPPQRLRLSHSTSKRLNCRRVFLRPKRPPEDDGAEDSASGGGEQTIEPNALPEPSAKCYEEALNNLGDFVATLPIDKKELVKRNFRKK